MSLHSPQNDSLSAADRLRVSIIFIEATRAKLLQANVIRVHEDLLFDPTRQNIYNFSECNIMRRPPKKLGSRLSSRTHYIKSEGEKEKLKNLIHKTSEKLWHESS